jgi:hypothetical protein
MKRRLTDREATCVISAGGPFEDAPISPPRAGISAEIVQKLDELQHCMLVCCDALLRQQRRNAGPPDLEADSGDTPTGTPPGLISKALRFFGRGETQ